MFVKQFLIECCQKYILDVSDKVKLPTFVISFSFIKLNHSRQTVVGLYLFEKAKYKIIWSQDEHSDLKLLEKMMIKKFWPYW